MPAPRVATTDVVVTWRGSGQVSECLDALAGQSRPHRTILLHNASDAATRHLLANHNGTPRVVRTPRNLGYAGALAMALSYIDTEFMAWLNDDTAPAPDWLARLEDAATAEVGAVGSRLELDDGTPQSLGVRLTGTGHGVDVTSLDDAHTARATFGFCGGAALLRTAALRGVGGVPDSFFCYYEDTDTAWRLRLAGWALRNEAGATVRHRHGVSTRPGSVAFHRWNERNRLLMLLRCAPA